ncbi:hypothetical protein FACS1894158_01350 [Betaproteobacteria bacterium]|nr:hypothetical protein FACS1894158_01350 [Betaproteobacteria bacterium]
MSLLMEVLKEAEETRRQGENTPGAPAATLTVEALEETSPTLAIDLPPPELSRHPDAVDAELAVLSGAPPMRHPPRSPLAASQATEALIERHAVPPATINTLWLIVGAGLLAILGVGGYFWWELQAIQSSGVSQPVAPRATPLIHPTLPTLPTPPTPPAAMPPAPLSPPPAEENGMVRPTPEATPVPSSGNSVMSTRAPTVPIAPLSPEQKPGNSASASEPRQEQTETKFRLTRATPQTNTTLEQAYEALQSGRDEEAKRGYEQVLRADGKNTDALLGLATLAARQGQIDSAHDYYLRALEADPSDATARAGVLSTGGQSDDDAENHLKTALARQPDSPSLLFALGNLFARQQRWSEAQQTYFQAYTGEADNPDIIFNLAVSLDHLRQHRLAAQYYQMALNAGASRTAAFDRSQVEVRLLQLQP